MSSAKRRATYDDLVKVPEHLVAEIIDPFPTWPPSSWLRTGRARCSRRRRACSTAGARCAVYARERVAHLWLVDPILRTIEIFRLEGGRWVVLGTHAGREPMHAEPLDAVALDVRRWWREP